MTREEAISIMSVIVHMLEPQYDTDRIEDAVEMAMKALEQEPKTGHWEWVQYDGNPKIGNYHCSACQCIVEDGKPSYSYCPQCGAKMKEGD